MGIIIPTDACRHAEAWPRATDTARRVILTHADMATETRSCVRIMAHNYAPSQTLMHIDFFTASSLIRIWWHTSGGESFLALTSDSFPFPVDWLTSPGTLSAGITRIRRALQTRTASTVWHTHGRTHTKTYIANPSRRCFLLFAFWRLYSALSSSAFSPSSLQRYLNGRLWAEQFYPILRDKSAFFSSRQTQILDILVAHWLVSSAYTKNFQCIKLSWIKVMWIASE